MEILRLRYATLRMTRGMYVPLRMIRRECVPLIMTYAPRITLSKYVVFYLNLCTQKHIFYAVF